MKNIFDTYTDDALLRLYRESRKSAYFITLYGRYTTLVYGVALKYFKNIPNAQDAAMQIWEELFEKVLYHDIQNFRAWLYTYVRNYCLMELRRYAIDSTVELDEKFMEFCDDFNLSSIKEDEKTDFALQECLKSLPEKQYICVKYFFMEELSYKEIVEESGFSLKMVKSFIQNGKRNLRLCLEKKGIHRKQEL